MVFLSNGTRHDRPSRLSTCLALAFSHIRRGALQRFMVRRSEIFTTIGCLLYGTITGREGNRDGKSGGRWELVKGRGANCFFYFSFFFFSFSFLLPFYCRFICRDLETELRPSAVDLSIGAIFFLPQPVPDRLAIPAIYQPCLTRERVQIHWGL